MSSEEIVNIGVSQGAVLGPLMFIIFINNIISCISANTKTEYADESNFIVSSQNIDDLVSRNKVISEESYSYFQNRQHVIFTEQYQPK